MNDDLVRGIDIPAEVIERVAKREPRSRLDANGVYREDRPLPDLTGKVVMVVADADGVLGNRPASVIRPRS